MYACHSSSLMFSSSSSDFCPADGNGSGCARSPTMLEMSSFMVNVWGISYSSTYCA